MGALPGPGDGSATSRTRRHEKGASAACAGLLNGSVGLRTKPVGCEEKGVRSVLPDVGLWPFGLVHYCWLLGSIRVLQIILYSLVCDCQGHFCALLCLFHWSILVVCSLLGGRVAGCLLLMLWRGSVSSLYGGGASRGRTGWSIVAERVGRQREAPGASSVAHAVMTRPRMCPRGLETRVAGRRNGDFVPCAGEGIRAGWGYAAEVPSVRRSLREAGALRAGAGRARQGGLLYKLRRGGARPLPVSPVASISLSGRAPGPL